MNFSNRSPALGLRRVRGRTSSTSNGRSGVSLLEILISIGVVGIGLLGVASLIPLAHYKATEGVREERKALFGKRAFRDFTVHGFNHVSNWYQSLPSDPTPLPIVHQTYVFDPHWIAHTRELMNSQNPPRTTFAFRFPDPMFPASNNVDINIPRIELRLNANDAYLQSQMLSTAKADAEMAAQLAIAYRARPIPLSAPAADEIFQLSDDLILPEVEESPDAVRINAYLTDDNGNRDKMMAAGSFSWMATLVPELKLVAPNLVPTNRYLMSIVVFNRRDLTGTFREEVIARVQPNFFLQGASKEVSLLEVDADNTVKENVGVKDIRVGDWIALYQKQPLTIAGPDPHLKQLKWYQVLAADEEAVEDQLTNGIDPTRILSLSGPDWTPNPSTPVLAVYLRNVVSVYEKTVELKP